MKSTGIVRHVDSLDRIVIPKELCKTLGIEPKGALEIFVDGNNIILEKHETASENGSKGNAGIVRHVDTVGRIVIPKEICGKLGIEQKDSLEIFVEDTKIILGKYEPACIFCKEAQDTVMYKKKLICEKCIRNLINLI
ncbi:MAG: AbrB/MazE/SpoVT family DNA-binding domain-containing protein [Clostridia bacterium]|nr:AbrB/MazE/SpoVT family DNA-binding domain-containing protein [Oscillospiraceae bacterium]MBQ7960096.1 AbrB/MazE/SpoVT family DNA-binding domain-containing protein [Clostridia bacterium]